MPEFSLQTKQELGEIKVLYFELLHPIPERNSNWFAVVTIEDKICLAEGNFSTDEHNALKERYFSAFLNNEI